MNYYGYKSTKGLESEKHKAYDVFCDNKTTIYIGNNIIFHEKTRH